MKLLIYLFFIFFFQFALGNPVTLKVCQDEKAYPPFQLSDSVITKTGRYGIIKTKINKAAVNSELRIEYIKRPWRRCTLMFREGRVDALLAAGWNQKRKGWGVFPRTSDGKLNLGQRLLRVRYYIFTHKDSIISWDGVQFKNLKTGIYAPEGYVVTKILRNHNALADSSSEPLRVIDVVAKERIDGFVSTERFGNYYIEKKGLTHKIKTLKEPLLIMDWYTPVSHKFYKNNKNIVQRFWMNLNN